MRSIELFSSVHKLLALAIFSVAAVCGSNVNAQSNHDAFDKPLGHDNGREEQAAHNYLNQTGREDTNGDSQSEPNQSNPNNSGAQRNVARQQQTNDQAGQGDRNDDDAQHHAALGVSLSESDGRVKVIAVLPGSPAARAGLQAGDQIRYVGDQRIATAEGLAEEIGEYKPGSQVELSIRRNGEKQTVTAKLESRQFAMSQRDRSNQDGNMNQQRNRQTNGDSQASRGRTAYSYRGNNPQNDGSQGQSRQRLQDLQRQISQLQQQLNDIQSSMGESRR